MSTEISSTDVDEFSWKVHIYFDDNVCIDDVKKFYYSIPHYGGTPLYEKCKLKKTKLITDYETESTYENDCVISEKKDCEIIIEGKNGIEDFVVYLKSILNFGLKPYSWFYIEKLPSK